MDETSAHKYLKSHFVARNENVLLGIGDDSAALNLSKDKTLLTSSDTLVENVHFLKKKITPFQLGQKAVAVAISDIGAMGGIPKFILSTIGIEKNLDDGFFKEVMQGISNSCNEFELDLVGGNLTGSKTLFIDIMAIGEINSDNMIKRSGANPGDRIYVTGNLGDSALGLKLLNSKELKQEKNTLVKRHLEPKPRLEVGFLLGLNNIPSAMIDVSDGLYLDLCRITEDFNMGAEIDLEKIPLSKEYLYCYHNFLDEKYSLAVTGGEDYELLFTCSPDKRKEIEEISVNTNIKITEIGIVTKYPKLKFVDGSGKEKKFKSKGFIHFN